MRVIRVGFGKRADELGRINQPDRPSHRLADVFPQFIDAARDGIGLFYLQAIFFQLSSYLVDRGIIHINPVVLVDHLSIVPHLPLATHIHLKLTQGKL